MVKKRIRDNKDIYSDVSLPDILSIYKDSDFIIKQKVRFMFYLIWVAIIGTGFLITSTIYVQIGSVEYDKIFYPIIGAEILLILFFGFCQFLTIRGKYILASFLFISITMVCVWFIMWTDTGNIIARFDTVVIILALLTLIPLITKKRKYAIFIYIIVNIILLIIYALYSKEFLNLPKAAVLDYIIDTSVAMLFIGIVIYYLHHIFRQTLDKAEQDINDRVRAEENLKKSELKYTEIFENAQIGIYRTTPDGEILHANPAMLELQGLKSIDEVKNKNLGEVDVFVNKNRPEFVEKMETDGYVKDFESTWVKRNGESIIVRENARAVRDNEGKTLYYEGFIVNITKRKLAEKALEESEHRYANLFENAQIGIYRTTLTGEILQVNPALIKMLGFKDLEDFNSRNFKAEDVFVNSDRNIFLDLIEEQGFVENYETAWEKKDGSNIIIKENARAVKDKKGNILFLEGFIENITDKKRAEETLKESELKYASLFENAKIGIFQATPEGEIIRANPALVEMLGFMSVKELVGKNLLTNKFFVSVNRSDFEELMTKQGFVSNFESEWKKKNGEVIILKENSRTVKDQNGRILYLEGFLENITERKKIEKALLESEEKYRSLMENMNDIVMLVDHDDKVLFVNDRFSEKLGYTESEIIGKIGYEILIDPEDQEKIIEANRRRKSDISNQYEAKFIAKDGTKFDFLISGAPVKDSEGNVIGSIGNMIDITERKIAEEKLKKSQQLFQTLAHVSPVGIFRTRADGYTTYVNPKWMEISGLQFEDALGNGWLQAVHPDDKKILQINWELRSTKGEDSSAEYRFIKPDGSIVWVLGYAVPEIVDDEIQGYIGTVTDITERKIAEKKIKESEERYRTIIEAFPDIIMISDLDKNILFANDKLEKVTGITSENYRNPDRKAGVHPDDIPIVENATEKLISGKETHTGIIEIRFIDTWGNIHWFSGIISKMYYNNQLVLQYITRDITEKKKIEQELAKYREHLEFLVKERTEELETTNEELSSTNEELHSQREELQVTLKNLQKAQKQLIQAEKMASLGVLASGVAHEINNPLNFIRGGAFGLEDYLQENLKDHLDNVQIFIDSINEGVERAATIVTSLNHYSHKDDSKITECNIHDIIDNCLNILGNQIRDIINIEKNYTTKNFLLKCNEGKMHQAILNIITNALQSIEGKGDIKIRTKARNKQLQIQITDNGYGISEESLTKIFDPFFTTKDPGKGTGLGLSITYNIIEEHNGNIKINSELYNGTTVIITLPIISK